MTTDDWGTPLGSDPDKPTAEKKPPARDTILGLIRYFTDNLPANTWGNLNAPVNVPAMTVGVKKLKSAGYSPDQIREMMRVYLVRIQQKPLPNGVAPWRGFLANLDDLAGKVQHTEEQSYDDLQPDHRL